MTSTARLKKDIGVPRRLPGPRAGRIAIGALLCGTWLLAGAGQTWADPIAITSGVLSLERIYDNPFPDPPLSTQPYSFRFTLAGEDFLLSLSQMPDLSAPPPCVTNPCFVPPASLGMTLGFAGTSNITWRSSDPHGDISGVVDGVPREGLLVSTAESAGFVFETTAARLAQAEAGRMLFTAPFVFLGGLTVWIDYGTSHASVRNLVLSGHGLATLELRGDPGHLTFEAIEYAFTAEPVPEPATLLLLGGGLGTLLARRSRKLRRGRCDPAPEP